MVWIESAFLPVKNSGNGVVTVFIMLYHDVLWPEISMRENDRIATQEGVRLARDWDHIFVSRA